MKLTEYSSQEITLNVQYIFQTIFTAKKVSTFINRGDSRRFETGALIRERELISFLRYNRMRKTKLNTFIKKKQKKTTTTVTNIH